MTLAVATLVEVRPGKRQQFGEAVEEFFELIDGLGIGRPRIWNGFVAGEHTGKVVIVFEYEDLADLAAFYDVLGDNPKYNAFGQKEYGPDGSMNLLGRYMLNEIKPGS